MPFKSESQRKWMYANHPEMAARWQAHTPKGRKLPEHVGKVKKAFWDGFLDELEKVAEENEDTVKDKVLRSLTYAPPVAITGMIAPRAATSVYAPLAGKYEKPYDEALSVKDYKRLRSELKIKDKIPFYDVHGGTSRAQLLREPTTLEDIRMGVGKTNVPDKALEAIAKRPGLRIIGDKRFPSVVAHELGHAHTLQRPFLSKLVKLRNGLAEVGLATSALMATVPDKDSTAVKAAPAVIGAAMIPHLLDEALASYQGMKALKRLGKYSPEMLSKMRGNLWRAFGSYAIPSAAMVAPVAAASYLRTRPSSEKTDDDDV